MIIRLLIFIANNGRYTLVAGLIAGFLLPSIAIIVKDLLPHLVAFLLFLTALRIGHTKVISSFQKFSLLLLLVLTLQLFLPLLAIGFLSVLQVSSSIFSIALILILAASSITGAPNFAILLDAKPEPAFQALIIGTALLPITVIPIFWVIPELGGFSEVFNASILLLITIFLTTFFGFFVRGLVFPKLDQNQTIALDGLTALTLAFMVIGLMAALRPALISDPLSVAKWLIFALIVNLGLQFITFHLLKLFKLSDFAVPIGIVSGNRNIALYLVALPIMQSEQLLIFLGCYQIPMYLTPIIMRKVYRNTSYNS